MSEGQNGKSGFDTNINTNKNRINESYQRQEDKYQTTKAPSTTATSGRCKSQQSTPLIGLPCTHGVTSRRTPPRSQNHLISLGTDGRQNLRSRNNPLIKKTKEGANPLLD